MTSLIPSPTDIKKKKNVICNIINAALPMMEKLNTVL